ncbi:MAG TPA: isoleucine--tRNA ligase [Candidatus Woesebacteria bacterium]|nr:isoleucine--tRNA ligase [Candidatus Woesebacteria bacterium]HPJ17059.1 isoleucine--tRNA ligase [Candidatus Woesebacteria bacterium]
MSYTDLPSNPSFSELEKQIIEWWYQHDIINQYLHKNDSADKKFSFIDGPITANGPMGVHHARGRALKDLFQRYKNLTGHQQRFQNGFDCQGLWVEVEVEKDNGFNSKKDIQTFGLDNFTQACVARVDKFASLQTEQSKRLGMFMDWENSYYTNSKTNNLYIWHFLKTIHQKGWLVKKKSATTWCPRCETGLSQHEQADGYKDITDTSVYLKFKLTNTENEYVLAWTTTPWTLSANVLLAINTDFEYVKAKSNQQYLYLAKTAADRLGLTDYQTIDPQVLLNQPYQSLYQIPAQENINHYITNWELVNPQEGTGVVHIAPGCGQEDFELGQKLNSDMIAPLDETGHFLSGYGDLSGLYAHDVNQQVFDYLQKNDALFKTESITHRYPHCWRCKTKCLFRLENSWYIKTDEIRPHLKKAAETVNWHPKYTSRRMQNWLDNMGDWMISRKRFYGLALPFYDCECGHLTVIGNLEELKDLAVNPSNVDSLKSLHRPYIDDIEIKCPHCGKNVKRVADVGDCWLDAGVVPFSTLNYLDHPEYWKKWFPADCVLEMIEQIRLWFYSMLFFGVAQENQAPYLNVVSHAEVRDEKGERMSKTKKNGIPFDDAVEKMTADAMRWLYYQQKPYISVNFGYDIANQVKRDFILILWNSFKFFVQHANLDNFQKTDFDPASVTNQLDKWIISRLHHTLDITSKTLDKYSTVKATEAIQSFVSDLSTWYIRRSRDRSDNHLVLDYVFNNLTVIISPFLPFISEVFYHSLIGDEFATSNKTVHTSNWPTLNSSLIDKNLEIEMSYARDICQEIHAQRQKAALKVRQPLAKATISCPQILSPSILEIIKEETNIKEIVISQSSVISATIDTNLTPELIAEGEYRDFVRQIQVLRKETGLKVNDKIEIIAPNWPESFEKQILAKTLAISIEKGDNLSIKLSR